jgi:hypothetical protein
MRHAAVIGAGLIGSRLDQGPPGRRPAADPCRRLCRGRRPSRWPPSPSPTPGGGAAAAAAWACPVFADAGGPAWRRFGPRWSACACPPPSRPSCCPETAVAGRRSGPPGGGGGKAAGALGGSGPGHRRGLRGRRHPAAGELSPAATPTSTRGCGQRFMSDRPGPQRHHPLCQGAAAQWRPRPGPDPLPVRPARSTGRPWPARHDAWPDDPTVSAFLLLPALCPEVFLIGLDERRFTHFEVDIIDAERPLPDRLATTGACAAAPWPTTPDSRRAGALVEVESSRQRL